MLEAIRTLKTLEIAKNIGGLETYFQNTEKNCLQKAGRSKEEFVQFQRRHYEEIDTDELNF